MLGLVACSPPTTETPPVETAIQTDAPAPTDDTADVVIPDGVIGTAELTPASGDNISGTVIVTAGGGNFDVALDDFNSDVPGGVQLYFSPWSETTTCLADMYSFSFGNLSTDADQLGLSPGDRDFSRGDPRFYLTAVITASTPGHDRFRRLRAHSPGRRHDHLGRTGHPPRAARRRHHRHSRCCRTLQPCGHGRHAQRHRRPLRHHAR